MSTTPDEVPHGESTDGPGPEPASYARAVAELEAILARLERDDVDVDVLAPNVRRAAELVRWCRAAIGVARLDVERIVADLDRLDTDAPEVR